MVPSRSTSVHRNAAQNGSSWAITVSGRSFSLRRQPLVTMRPFFGVECHNDLSWIDSLHELAEEAGVDLAGGKCRAADDDLLGARFRDCGRAGDAANSASYAHFHFVFGAGLHAEFVHQLVVAGFAHGGVEVDDVQPRIVAEFIEEAEYVRDREFAAASVNELHGLPALQVDAGDQHGRRTSMLRRREECFEVANGLHAVMENGSGQRCVGCAIGENFREMLGKFGAAGSDYGDRDGAGDSGGQGDVETLLRAVAVDRGEQNFSRLRVRRPVSPK